MPTKKIRFDYFKPCLRDNPSTEVDMSNFFSTLNTLPLKARSIPHPSGHRIRLDRATLHQNYHPEELGHSPFPFSLWDVVFTRIRPDVPGITTSSTPDLHPMQLEDDEYVAEATTILYDPELNYFVIQRNRTGAPPSAIERFFNNMLEPDDPNIIVLEIVLRNDMLDRALTHTFHHSIALRMRNTRGSLISSSIENNQTLSHLIQAGASLATDEEYPIQAELVLKIPATSKTSTFRDAAYRKMLNITKKLANDDLVDKLVVKGKTDEDAPFEEVDLIKDATREWISFEVAPNRFIASSTIFDKLAIAFSERRVNL